MIYVYVIIRAIKADAFARISPSLVYVFFRFRNNDAVSEHSGRLVRDEKATSVGFFLLLFLRLLFPRGEALEDAAR